MNYLPTCTSRLVVQHPCQVSLKSMQGCRRSWEDKLWWDGRTEWRKDGRTEGRTKQTLNAPLPFYGGGIKINWIDTFFFSLVYVGTIIDLHNTFQLQNYIACVWLEKHSVRPQIQRFLRRKHPTERSNSLGFYHYRHTFSFDAGLCKCICWL